MSSPTTSVSSFFDSMKRAASPLIDKLKYALSPISRSEPVGPAESPTKARTNRGSRTISSSLRDKNKTIVLGKPLQKVHKMPSQIGKKKQPKMAVVKQLKDPVIRNKAPGYLERAVMECKKEGTILQLQSEVTQSIGQSNNIKEVVESAAPVTFKNKESEQMDVDRVIPTKAPKIKPTRSRIKLFAPPSLEDPEFVEKYPFKEINQPHYESVAESIEGIDKWTRKHPNTGAYQFS
eukprot:NODE_125_length_18781_cov_0.243015.p6 type:complete len:235 gc:universal NODE_125_length_18781_cov_0.243015:8473-7769(-)